MPNHARLVEPLPMEMGKRKKNSTKLLDTLFGLRLEAKGYRCLSTQQNQEKIVILVFNPHFISR